MCRTLTQSGAVAPISELVTETIGGERAAELCDQKRQIAACRCVNCSLQPGHDRNRQGYRLGLPVFHLRERKPAILDVLSAELNDVRSSLTGEEQ